LDVASLSEFSSSDSGFARFLAFGAAFAGFAGAVVFVALGFDAAAFLAGAFAF
jgi:hypothetical protein